MNARLKELKILGIMLGVFLAAYYIPFGAPRFLSGLHEAFFMLQDYARLHVLLCLIPALFIAGAVSVFISKSAVIKYLGPKANKILAYTVASVSGAILAVCSCTVLPLFTGIYKRGAGLGPAVAFLYSGPAINVLAIVLTARILGLEIGIARAVGAVVFSVILGLIMHFIFRKEELQRQGEFDYAELQEESPLWQKIIYFALMILILITLTWAKPGGSTSAFMSFMYAYKWIISGILAFGLGLSLVLIYGFKLWKVLLTAVVVTASGMLFPAQPLIAYIIGLVMLVGFLRQEKGELKDWLGSTWSYTKLIMPLLFVGVMIAGSLLGRPGHEAWIPSYWVEAAVGGNSFGANFFASISGAFMYFATLTEVPILQGLLGSGMGKGPALALLLSGPALSLPSMLVINTVLGLKKTSAFIALVVMLSTITGFLFGTFFV
ncbi:MAG: permease [Candidatus Cloacimonetes bacterium]|nr:permease [Candidatus Cloacimonadota bacterium]MDY0228680.1 permease [Candidatus Cloacimonadaceae bacterium]